MAVRFVLPRGWLGDETFPADLECSCGLTGAGLEFHRRFDKLHTLWGGETGVEVGDLERVNAPTLVLNSDSGLMTFEHLGAVHRALRDCQVAVVPGTSHGLGMEKPHIVNQLILDFLADDQVERLFALPKG